MFSLCTRVSTTICTGSRNAGIAEIALITAIAAMALISGCKDLPASKPEALFTPDEARGAQVFHVYCAQCHRPTTTRGLKGPGLQALTKVKAMPSGAPPTDERLIQTILHGHGMMQGVPMSDENLQYLLAYLHTL
jgi:mono/diheme cytochrome c family protein